MRFFRSFSLSLKFVSPRVPTPRRPRPRPSAVSNHDDRSSASSPAGSLFHSIRHQVLLDHLHGNVHATFCVQNDPVEEDLLSNSRSKPAVEGQTRYRSRMAAPCLLACGPSDTTVDTALFDPRRLPFPPIQRLVATASNERISYKLSAVARHFSPSALSATPVSVLSIICRP